MSRTAVALPFYRTGFVSEEASAAKNGTRKNYLHYFGLKFFYYADFIIFALNIKNDRNRMRRSVGGPYIGIYACRLSGALLLKQTNTNFKILRL